ncbi:RRQRL motif-containing zinc-binding protein, partial [Nocardia fluminea]|uniref:RRQRL motif-containing zinc-binding protein n=1 Tax=Nocardia fluminea TaxID=134984 RepID=UPI0037A9B46E
SALDEQPDTYPWRAAPSHLMTRRQLRAAGLRPDGQDPAALMVREPAGRKRRRMWAYLFDSRKAAPKRTATPAQLNAVEKAVRGRKLRAAQCRGLTEADLTQPGDPGPAWNTHKEETPMSDTTSHLSQSEQDSVRAEAAELDAALDRALEQDLATWPTDGTPVVRVPNEAILRAAEQLDDHLRTHRSLLGEELTWQNAYDRIDQKDTELATIGADTAALAAHGLIDTATAALVTAAINGEDLAGRDFADESAGEITALTVDERASQMEAALNSARRGKDAGEIAAAREALLEHLHLYRSEVGHDPHWSLYYSRIDHRDGPEPVGHGQRVARLHALVAVNSSRDDRDRRDARLASAAQRGASEEDLEAARAGARTGAEARMAQIPWHNPDACAMMLGEALTWREESPLAAERADQLIASYAASWGVIVDPVTGSVRIDPAHDAPARQEYAEAAAVWAREHAAVGALAAAPLNPAGKAAVEEALQRWSGEGVDPQAPRTHIDTQDERRARLAADLDEAKLSESDRALVDFTVDYLRGDTRDLDLLDTPVMVDPGVEARGRMGALLTRYAGKSASAQLVAEDLAVMSPSDQETVREIGRAIKAGQKPDLDPWPEFVDREQLLEQIEMYAIDAEEQHMEADFLVEEDYEYDQIGVSDDIGTRIARMAAARDNLRGIAVEGKGLAPIERAQLTAVLDDIDIGYISRRDQLPEMMWADERTKADLDYLRSSDQAAQVKRGFVESVTQQVDGSGAQPTEKAASAVRASVRQMGDTLYNVSCGMTEGVDKAREAFVAQRTELGRHLAQAGVGAESMGAIRAGIDTTARQAGVLGRTADQRSNQWQARTEQIVTQRNDSLAQQQAAASGRGSRGSRASKSTGSDRGKSTSNPAPARNPAVAGRRQLHTPEVGR